MSKKNEIPARLKGRAFSVAEGSIEGMSAGMFRRMDVVKPFHGVRTLDCFDPGTGNVFEHHRKLILKRCRDYLPRLRAGHFFSHQTAAEIWGVPLPLHAKFGSDGAGIAPESQIRLHVTSIAPFQEPRIAGVIGYQTRDRQIRSVIYKDFSVTDPVSTLFTLAAATENRGGVKTWLLSIHDLIAAADYLVHVPAVMTDKNSGHPLTTIEELTARAHLFRGKGKQRLMEVLPRVRIGSESRMESLLRLKIVDSGLPEPQLNINIRDAAGIFIGRADLVYPDFRVIIEYDGDQHRTDRIQYEKDIDRVEKFENEEWNYLRVLRSGLFPSFEKTRQRIERALRQGGWSPG